MSRIQQQDFSQKKKFLIVGIIFLSLIVVVEIWYLLGIWRGQLITFQTILSAVHPSPTPTDEPIPTDTPFPTATPIPTFPPIDMDVTHWNTYRNIAVGISFKYPKNWKTVPYPTDTNVDSATSISGHGIIQLAPDANVNDAVIEMAYWNNPKQLSVTAYNLRFYNPGFPHDGLIWENNLSTAQSVTVGGKQAYFLANAVCDPVGCNHYLIPANNKIFDLYQFLGTGDHPGLSDTDISKMFTQILSTFKFITP